MRFEWTIEGLDRIRGQGVAPEEVHHVLAGPGSRLIQSIDGSTRRVLGRTADARLVEVWLRESGAAEEVEVWTAFEAGLTGQATWKNAFGDGGEDEHV